MEPASSQLLPSILQVLPSILWFLLAAAVLVLFYRPIRDDLLPHLSGFKAAGVELSFVKESIDAAIQLAEKSPQWTVQVSAADKERTLRRAKAHLPILRNAQLLWLDDHPENNANERRMFTQLGVEVEPATSTDEALSKVIRGNYDVVVSDMRHGDDPTGGLKFLDHLRPQRDTPVIFYIGNVNADKGIPPRAFGITNRPDELLHLVLDVLERRRA